MRRVRLKQQQSPNRRRTHFTYNHNRWRRSAYDQSEEEQTTKRRHNLLFHLVAELLRGNNSMSYLYAKLLADTLLELEPTLRPSFAPALEWYDRAERGVE